MSKGDFTITKYLQNLVATFEELAEIGDPVKDEDLVLFALNGLPRDFKAFITMAEFQLETLTFSDLRAKLLLHEQRVFDYHNPGFSVAHDMAFCRVWWLESQWCTIK